MPEIYLARVGENPSAKRYSVADGFPHSLSLATYSGDGGNRTRVQRVRPAIHYKLSRSFHSRRLGLDRQSPKPASRAAFGRSLSASLRPHPEILVARCLALGNGKSTDVIEPLSINGLAQAALGSESIGRRTSVVGTCLSCL